MPSRALFYPEWAISDPRFLFDSLLYWDRLGCIVPNPGFKPWLEVTSDDKEMAKALAEANERFVTPCLPTPEQKARAHEKIEEFAVHRAPMFLRPGHLSSGDRAVLSSEKLAHETVELLREKLWMRQGGGLDMNVISSAAANLVMAALASECASEEMPPMTDDPTGFAASCDLVLNRLGIPRRLVAGKEGDVVDSPQEDLSFLLEGVPHLALKDGRIDHRMLKKLIQAREKPDVAGLQEKFRTRVDTYLLELRNVRGPQRQVIRDSFKAAVKRDLASLQKDLALAGLETLATKEGMAAIALGAVAGTAAPGAGAVLGLLMGLIGYKKTRKEKLENHWTSWLFAAERPRFSFV